MSLLDRIRTAFSGKQEGVARDTSRIYLVDGDRIAEGGERPGPAERFQILQRLARFAEREKVQMQVVLGGRALREVAHGGEFGGLRVFYSEQTEGIGDQIVNLIPGGSRREKAVVITNDAQLEARVLDLGAQVMKASTLRKGMEGGGGEGEPGGRLQQRRRDRGRRGDRGDRRGGERRPEQQGEARELREPREPREGGEPQRPPQEPGADTTVKNLIDLVE